LRLENGVWRRDGGLIVPRREIIAPGRGCPSRRARLPFPRVPQMNLAVTFVAATTTVGGTTIAKPTGTADDDILGLFMIGYDDSTGTFAAPSGFTASPAGRISIDNGAQDTCCEFFWKKAASEGAGPYGATFKGGACDMAMVAYRGCDLTTPIGIDSGTQHAGSTSSYTASWTSATAPRIGIALACAAGYENDVPTPAGYTSRAFFDSVNRIGEKTVTASENVNPSCTVTSDTLSRNTAGLILIVLQQPGAATPSDVVGAASQRVNQNTLLRM
jgi:hypothetical protein